MGREDQTCLPVGRQAARRQTGTSCHARVSGREGAGLWGIEHKNIHTHPFVNLIPARQSRTMDSLWPILLPHR
jgi:hypothetical protein